MPVHSLVGHAAGGDSFFVPCDSQWVTVVGAPNVTHISRHPVISFDAAADEMIASMVALPSDWATFHIDLFWCAISTGTGDVYWQVRRKEMPNATDLSGASKEPLTGTAVAAASAGASVVVKTRLETGIAAPAAGVPLALNLYRIGPNAADTYASDASAFGLLFTKAS